MIPTGRSHASKRETRNHVRAIDPELLHQEMASGRRLVVVDIRPTEEAQDGRIPGAVAIPIGDLLARKSELEDFRHDPVIIVSTRGISARLAGIELEFAGFSDVQTLEGGMVRWQELGLPTRADHAR